MNFKALLQNKAVLFGAIGVIVLAIILMIVFNPFKGSETSPDNKKLTEDFNLLTTDNIGKAIEIQALLARSDVELKRKADGSKSTLYLEKGKATMKDRDTALLEVVNSGLMDEHMGLEIFDKGDFTSTKDDKRIRLARAINGELSRLIRKIKPIENASVFVSIPEPTIFTSMKKPTTATVQLVIPSGDKLDKLKIKAITNLLIGSVHDLQAENISITDTNGNVYSSIMGSETDMLDVIEENDQYMKNKVQIQLDRLVGKGNYVVTVSTFLRQAPLETEKILYNPRQKAVINAQTFQEGLGDRSRDKSRLTNAVSSYLPGGLPTGPDSSSNRNYSRSAQEVQYGVSKTQMSEFKKPGTIEEISVAVTLDQGAMPPGMTLEQMKDLVARAASPKVNPANVEIAFSETLNPLLASERPAQLPKPEGSGNPWWTVAALLAGGLIIGLIFISKKVKDSARKHQEEIDALAERTRLQERQIKEMSTQAATLIAQQEQLQHTLTTRQALPVASNLQETMSELKDNLEEDEGEFGLRLKSWIESTG